ncbi:hypothetical protein QL285_082298 [Trifolium repens]|nr:hypothetical protein QL285_082298 [Trifolium repens]
MDDDDRNFYSILGNIVSDKLTKTDPNTKENLQNQGKSSRQSKKYKKKEKKCEDLCCSSCHDGFHRATMEATCSPRHQQKKICSSCYDGPHRSTMALLGDQADETHKISYNFELNLPIVLRWTHRSTMAC